MIENRARIQFVREFYRRYTPMLTAKSLFELLNLTFAEEKGFRLYKDYNAFRSNRAYLIKTGKVRSEHTEYIQRPNQLDECIKCPSCYAKLMFKDSPK